MTASYRFTRIDDGRKTQSDRLGDIVGGDPAGECWLFVSPHDDDLAIGAGLLMQAASVAGVAVRVLVVTDGCLGYCRLDVAEPRGKGAAAIEALAGLDRYRGDVTSESGGTYASFMGTDDDNTLLITHWDEVGFVIQLTIITPKAASGGQ